ncbi:MAG TPA: TA0938 family protein [Thermoplasmata archaeon]|nr:TA0938 family protein [Thermoplasmata archaeon]
MKLREDGCVLCGSTWGDVWRDVDGTRCFFCCELCARQFANLLQAVRRATEWSRIDALEIAGDRRGREVTVRSGAATARFSFLFGYEGEVRRFRAVPSVPA